MDSRNTTVSFICQQIGHLLLFWKDLTKTLTDWGFKLNPYDPCVANADINGSQCTIAWYVDDNKISHKDPKVVDWVIAEIEKEHGKMTVTRGKKHTFIGMDIEYVGNGRVKITTKDYITESIAAYPETINKKATSGYK